MRSFWNSSLDKKTPGLKTDPESFLSKVKLNIKHRLHIEVLCISIKAHLYTFVSLYI